MSFPCTNPHCIDGQAAANSDDDGVCSECRGTCVQRCACLRGQATHAETEKGRTYYWCDRCQGEIDRVKEIFDAEVEAAQRAVDAARWVDLKVESATGNRVN